jgi:hypothetical protein
LDEVNVIIDALKDAVSVVRSIGHVAGMTRAYSQDVHAAKQLLGLKDPAGEAYRSDAVHPLYTGGVVHPDNQAALTATGADVLGAADGRDELVSVDPAQRSLLLFGSPTSEGLSRIIFGYEAMPEAEGLLYADTPFDLAYRWELSPDRAHSGVELGRFVRDRGLVKRPPWGIKALRTNTDLVPTGRDEMLKDDYLLITRIPNFLSPHAAYTNQFIVSFGGAHGTGTKAVGLLLKNRQLLARVAQELRSKQTAESGRSEMPRAFQVLLQVTAIDHKSRESRPRQLSYVDATPLSATEDWDGVRKRLSGPIERWHRGVKPVVYDA